MNTQRLPIIVPDDDTTHEAISAAILRATGYRMLDPDVIVRALRLLSVAHRDGIEDATVAAILDRARRAEEDREFEKANYARKLDELREQHARRLASTQQAVADLVRIGRRVVDARNRGRKTVRVADLLDGGVRVVTRPVLDVTAGTRAMWFDKADQRTLFGDARTESVTVTDRTRGRQDGTRTLNIAPDIQLDFRALPFASESFRLVVFDPPHLTRAGAKSWLAARYGVLGSDWRDDLKQGFAECFRVLMPGGVLIFKWSEVHVPLREVLALTDARPLFGHASGKRSGTHWVSFLKDES